MRRTERSNGRNESTILRDGTLPGSRAGMKEDEPGENWQGEQRGRARLRNTDRDIIESEEIVRVHETKCQRSRRATGDKIREGKPLIVENADVGRGLEQHAIEENLERIGNGGRWRSDIVGQPEGQRIRASRSGRERLT